jgi:hypothetical protein
MTTCGAAEYNILAQLPVDLARTAAEQDRTHVQLKA